MASGWRHVDQQVGDRGQPERGDGAVGGVGGRHAEARDTSPTVRPSASVRRMHSTLIGPTAAAMVKPRTKPRASSSGSIDAGLAGSTR